MTNDALGAVEAGAAEEVVELAADEIDGGDSPASARANTTPKTSRRRAVTNTSSKRREQARIIAVFVFQLTAAGRKFAGGIKTVR
jgi:hypothetical protein